MVSALLSAARCAVAAATALVDRPDPRVDADHPPHHLPEMVRAAVSAPAPLPRTGWVATADSEETAAGDFGAARALDGDPATSWQTSTAPAAVLPHSLTIDTRDTVSVSGLTYQPPTSPEGRIGQYRIEVSADGTAWSAPVATGTFADDTTVKTATFATVLARFVRLTAVTEAGGRVQRSAAAEVNLLGGTDPALPRTGWTVTADSQELSGENGAVTNVLDGSTTTIWHSKWSGGATPLPHVLTVDMHATNLVSGLSYLPRPAPSRNGNIGQYRIETSTDAAAWGVPVATGSFADTNEAQTAAFPPVLARYVRLTALTEAGGRGPWTSAAEVNLLGRQDPTLARTGWKVTADSQELSGENGAVTNVLDGSATTIWHTRWSGGSDPLPHTLTIDTHANPSVGGITYLPRPAASGNGRIGQYRIAVSADAATWTTVTTGAFADNAALKSETVPTTAARYVRLTAVTEAGNRGQWTSAAEVNLLGPSGGGGPARGAWSAPIGFPLVPAAAALLPNGRVLTWSSYTPTAYGGSGRTYTATFDPATNVVTQRTVTETGHDMFCPGISMLGDGRIVVTGGDDSAKTSIYQPSSDTWATGPLMNIPRGYQASVTLSDGRVFAIGGSWSGGQGGKHGEVWSAAGGWQRLTGAPVTPMLTNDAQGVYRADNHGWLFAWSGGTVLQAGPSRAMNWYGTAGTGSTTPAGPRGDDGDAMTGNAVMYDAGRILAAGGSPNYQNSNATTNAYVITLAGSTATVRRVAPMANPRAFANSVVLPDGKVAVFGGQNYAVPLTDNTAVLSPEIWDPVTETFTTMAPALVPRTYHSVALLLPDGRVFTGGGGLCASCGTNHLDAEIFTPPNLLNPDGTPASRPAITSAPTTAANGATITVATDRAVTGFALIRFGSATHNLNTDQRRIALAPTAVTGGYSLTVPADRGVAVPGYYMLFALDSQGVPSVARTIRVG
jgi:galactose oxidase